MKINSNDLRLGNYYLSTDNTIKQVDLDFFYLLWLEVPIDDLVKSPIEIDEDILSKCGFVESQISDMWHYLPNDWWHIVKSKGEFIFRGMGASVVRVKYLNELQNLMNILLGKEIEVKL